MKGLMMYKTVNNKDNYHTIRTVEYTMDEGDEYNKIEDKDSDWNIDSLFPKWMLHNQQVNKGYSKHQQNIITSTKGNDYVL